MKIYSHTVEGVWYERADDELRVHESDSGRVISAPLDIALNVLYFKSEIMSEIRKVIACEEVNCPVCGKTFVTKYIRTKTCSEVCQAEYKKRLNAEHMRQAREKKKPRNSRLVETAQKATKAGMTYGQYKAQETIEKYGRVIV